ncbi:hypothetical protein SEA_LILYPAD_55 [Gordonia phage LilyPad]|nr:hypothetical protein SEA_LILYPAD_55 [Gordonia phage LilyPad]
MSEDTTATTEEGRVVAPRNVEELAALPAVKATEASTSFANFMNKHLANAEGYTPITPEQAWTLIYTHRVWQGSDERAAEKEALKSAKEGEKEAKRQEREAKKAERERIAAEKKAEKERKAAEKAAKEAEAGEDLEAADTEGEGEIAPRKRKPRSKKPAPSTDETPAETPAEEPVAAGVDGF